MNFDIEYSEEKNEVLKRTRGIGFEDIVEAIVEGCMLDDIIHPNKSKYPNQKIYIVKVHNYAYGVPYVIDKEQKKIFLKTIYPSRVFTKKFIKNYEK